jgi:hypothetical protein
MTTPSARSSVVGVFREREQARDAIQALRDAGFEAGDIGLLMRDRAEAPTVAAEEETEHHAGAGAATGAVAGGVLGGLATWLAGIGALALPGVGPVVAAGGLASVLAGAAVGATAGGALGGIAGALVGLGVPPEEAGWYEHQVHRGGSLVTVRAGGRDAEAQGILRRHGAADVQRPQP